MSHPADPLARIRGNLAAEPLGARGLSWLARNPGCQRARVLGVAGVSAATAAARVYGLPDAEAQSPFALAAGNRFEREVLREDAERLLGAYREAGFAVRAPAAVAFVANLAPGKGAEAIARREALTRGFVAARLRGHPSAPDLVVKPRLTVRLLGLDHGIEPDAFVALAGSARYVPVEIKSYPDRDGKSDPTDIRAACAQAAIGWLALAQLLERLGGSEAPPRRRLGHLVLRRPGSYRPTVREMTLDGEVELVLRTLGAEGAPDEARRLVEAIAPGAALDDPAVLDALATNYLASCKDACALAPRCKGEAIQAAEPVLIGGGAREELAAAGSLARALELLHGTGAPAGTDQERELAARLRAAHAHYAEALGHGG